MFLSFLLFDVILLVLVFVNMIIFVLLYFCVFYNREGLGKVCWDWLEIDSVGYYFFWVRICCKRCCFLVVWWRDLESDGRFVCFVFYWCVVSGVVGRGVGWLSFLGLMFLVWWVVGFWCLWVMWCSDCLVGVGGGGVVVIVVFINVCDCFFYLLWCFVV